MGNSRQKRTAADDDTKILNPISQRCERCGHTVSFETVQHFAFEGKTDGSFRFWLLLRPAIIGWPDAVLLKDAHQSRGATVRWHVGHFFEPEDEDDQQVLWGWVRDEDSRKNNYVPGVSIFPAQSAFTKAGSPRLGIRFTDGTYASYSFKELEPQLGHTDFVLLDKTKVPCSTVRNT